MALSVAEIRRLEAVEHRVHELSALIEHSYNQNNWERPPLPEFPGEYGLRDQRPPTIPPAALDQMMANLSDADRAALLRMFSQALQPQNQPPAPLPDVVPAPPPASAQTPAPRLAPETLPPDEPVVVEGE